VVTVAATAAVTETVVQGVVNGANATNAAAQSASLRLGAAVDLTVPGGVIAARQFVQGALRPTSAPATIPGLLGAAANVAFSAIKKEFF